MRVPRRFATRSALLNWSQILVPDQRQQRRSVAADAELPANRVGRLAPGAEIPAAMEAVLVMRGANGDAIVARVPAAARAEHDMMIVQIPPRAARRDRTPPAVARENGIPMARPGVPLGAHVLEEPLEAAPPR